MSLSNIILYTSILIVALPLVAGLWYYRQLDKPSHIIFLLVVVAAIPQLLTLSLINTKDMNLVYNIYTLFEFSILYFFIGCNFQRQAFRKISFFTIIVFLGSAVWLIFRYGLYQKWLNELVCVANIAYLVWVFMFILESLLNETKLMNAKLPVFWFVIALLFYTPCTIFVVAMSHYIKDNPFMKNLWSIHGVFNILMYAFFAIGFYKSHLRLKQGCRQQKI